jgi:outer membrane immunogenic protein
MKKHILTMTVAIAALGTAASAGSLDVTPVEPTPVTPVEVVPVAPVGTWTGGYAGLSLGGAQASSGGSEETGLIYGLHGGSDYQFGNGIVLGGEAEFQGNDDLSVNGFDVDNVSRAKARMGYDLGPALVYGTAGVSKVNTSIGEATSPVYGLGMEYKVTDRFSVGAEYLNEDFENLGSTETDLQQDSISLRGNFRF